ncbi:MAG: hypothetical protein WC742_03505 [Gallionellaceae bacterium]
MSAAQGTFSLGSGVDYSSGKYGVDDATDIVYIPIVGKFETDNWLFKLTVPYVSVTGPENEVPDGDEDSDQGDVKTDSGWGDMVATVSYSLINSARTGVIVDITGKVKFGTADKAKNLGSGANDFAGEASVYKIMGKTGLFGTLGYKVFGQSIGYEFNNVYYGSVGISQKVGIDSLTSIGVIYDYQQATSTLSDPQQIWTAFLNRKINSKWKAQLYLFTGAGTASPDLGFGTMLSQSF